MNIPNRNERYPGPGSYIRFSEFGVLDPNYKKRRIETEPSKRTEEIKNEETKEDKDEQYPNEDEKVKQNENTHKQEEKIKQSERVENDEEKNKNIQNEPIQEENPNFDNTIGQKWHQLKDMHRSEQYPALCFIGVKLVYIDDKLIGE